jgi:hypothetical protein
LICKYCGKDKPIEDFAVALKIETKIYRRKRCKACKQKLVQLRRLNIRNWLNKYKSDAKCSNCGFDDFRSLVFHHEDPSQKEIAIANITGLGLSKENIKKELDKCIVLCANCHLILHYNERNRGVG